MPPQVYLCSVIMDVEGMRACTHPGVSHGCVKGDEERKGVGPTASYGDKREGDARQSNTWHSIIGTTHVSGSIGLVDCNAAMLLQRAAVPSCPETYR